MLYGIRNCDTVKKARAFLEATDVPYDFHDFKKNGVAPDDIARWLELVPVDRLINKRGTSWRALSDRQRSSLTPETASELAIDNPSLIKRPVVDWGDDVTVGFDAQCWTARLARLA